MHLCIRPRSLAPSLSLPFSVHGCRCGTHDPAARTTRRVRNPFPTLVMAGIVNSIASELDAVVATRYKESGPSNAARGTYRDVNEVERERRMRRCVSVKRTRSSAQRELPRARSGAHKDPMSK